jgi:ABC-type transport system substrate-binding protein
MLTAGFVLLAVAGVGLAARGTAVRGVKEGGTLRLNISTTDVQSVDPAVAYEQFSWVVGTATCLKLINYPDRNGVQPLVPEAAVGLPRVSEDGRTYEFTIRKGQRFNTGEAVTAESFAYQIRRILTPKVSSPGASFLHDVVGANAVLAGKAKTAAGVRVSGNALQIRLKAGAPDFLARMAMNFFCAVPLDYPIQNNLQEAPAAAGPYYIAQRTPNRQLLLQRNPNYKGKRPHHVDAMTITVNTDLRQSYLQVERGEVDNDLAGVPAPTNAGLTKKYGINKGRYWVHPGAAINFIILNMSRAPFSDVKLRKAVNYAIDRPAITRQLGLNAGTPTDQILPPAIRGYRDAKIYPLNGPNLVKAKQLAGNTKATANLYIPAGDPAIEAEAEVIRANLARIGITVKVKKLAFAVFLSAIGNPKEPYDMALYGWFADYLDPYDFINVLLDGNRITQQNNINTAQMNIPEYNERMAAAGKLSGPRRYATYGQLDIDIMREVAPWASTSFYNTREFVSSRVGCYVYQPAFGWMDLAAVCLK